MIWFICFWDSQGGRTLHILRHKSFYENNMLETFLDFALFDKIVLVTKIQLLLVILVNIFLSFLFAFI